MNTAFIRLSVFAAAVLVFFSAPPRAIAQDSLASARALYASAAYEDALGVLNRLEPSAKPSERLALNQYKSFCLFALRRNAEAEQAIEAVLADEPSYAPSETEASPRLLSAFASVRQRILPGVVQQKYAHAKGRFDRKEFAAAVAEFDQVLQLLTDASVAELVTRPPLSDIRTLAHGFRDLSVRALPPPPPAAPIEAPPAPPVAVVAIPRRVYNAGESRVTPPVVLRQEMPPMPRGVVLFQREGVLEVVINEVGSVEMATMRSPIDPRYDHLLLAQTQTWRFQPATVGGTPVKFRKVIAVKISSDRTP